MIQHAYTHKVCMICAHTVWGEEKRETEGEGRERGRKGKGGREGGRQSRE